MFEQLALESRDLYQAEKKITFAKDEQIHKMTTIFTQKRSKIVILSENSCHFVNLLIYNNGLFLLSLN